MLLVVLVWAQIRARRFNPWLYWATIVASTTCGTTLADFADRSLGIGYPGGSLLLLACVLLSLFAWHRTLGTVDVNTHRHARSAETFYWITITFSQTLGTALGDWAADQRGSAIGGGALVFGAGAGGAREPLFHDAGQPRLLFWAAFILTRPLGATVGDFLDKPVAQGGLALSRPIASAVLAVAIVLLILRSAAAAGQPSGNGGIADVKLVRRLAFLALAGTATAASAGPPYQTDDPVPTDAAIGRFMHSPPAKGGVRRLMTMPASISTMAPSRASSSRRRSRSAPVRRSKAGTAERATSRLA